MPLVLANTFERRAVTVCSKLREIPRNSVIEGANCAKMYLILWRLNDLFLSRRMNAMNTMTSYIYIKLHIKYIYYL